MAKTGQIEGAISTLLVDEADPAQAAETRHVAALKLATVAAERDAVGDLSEILQALGITRASLTPAPPRDEPLPQRNREHGTDAGWHNHKYRAEQPCADCITAHDIALAEWRMAREAAAEPEVERIDWSLHLVESRFTERDKPAECGSTAGFVAHRSRRERACPLCCAAWFDWSAQRVAAAS
jgi:hypothetical protein